MVNMATNQIQQSVQIINELVETKIEEEEFLQFECNQVHKYQMFELWKALS